MIVEVNYLTVMMLAAIVSALGGLMWAVGRSLLQQYGNMLRDQLADHRNDTVRSYASMVERLNRIEQAVGEHATQLTRIDSDLSRVPTDEDLEKIYNRINAYANDMSELKGSLRGIEHTLRALMSRITERGLQ